MSTGESPRGTVMTAFGTALALVAFGLQIMVAFPASAAGYVPTDISLDLVAAGPFTYDHLTLAGTDPLPRFGSRTISKTDGVVESLEGGDFACGDLVIFYGQVLVRASASGSDGTVEIDMSFLAEPTGQPGAGFDDIQSVGISQKDDLAGGGNENLDGNETVSLINERDGQTSGKEARLGTVVITHLDPGDALIYQAVGHLGCAPGTSPTGTIQTAITAGRIDTVSFGVGNQTVPFKKTEDLAQPGLQVTKSCPATATAGQSITYLIGVSNSGNETLNSITVQDSILGNLSGSFADSLTAGASETNSFNYTVKATDPDPLVNTVTVNGVGASSGLTVTAQASCTTSIPKVDVTVSKATSAPTAGVAPGTTFNFTLVAAAAGTADATGVTVTDAIPTGLTINSATFTGGSNGPGTCSVSGQNVTCNIGTLAKGATATVTISVTATPGACPSITNRATVTATNETASNTGNNTSNSVTVPVVCPGPDAQISKTTGAPSTGVKPGDSFTFTLTVTNAGGGDATGVVVTDAIPAGLNVDGATFTGGSNGPGTCTVSGQNVTCSIGDLASGASASVTITVTATADACPMVTNRATVTATNEDPANASNNTSNDVTVLVNCDEPPPPEPGVSIRISKTNDADGDGIYTDNEEADRSGLDVPFLLAITNTGDTTVRISDLVDRFDTTTLDLLEHKCANLAGQTLDPGESVTCNFVLRNYSPNAEDTLENTVQVCVQDPDSDAADCDKNPSKVRSNIVLGRTITKTPPAGTAFTGPDDGTMTKGLLALALLVLGTGLLWGGYRRRASYDG